MPTLRPHEVKTIYVGQALVSGEDNTITVWGGGHESSVMISDVMPARTNTFAYPAAPCKLLHTFLASHVVHENGTYFPPAHLLVPSLYNSR